MNTATLPHGPYMDLVHACLADEGITPRMWLSTPDGEQLDAVYEFDDRYLDEDEWPDGVYLAWNQNDGWVLTDTGSSRSQYPLKLHTYARPQDVATIVAAQLRGQPTPTVPCGPWAHDITAEAVAAWEAES